MLTVELVPKTAWYKNLRSELPREKWNRLRKTAYENASYRCEICGGKGDRWPVEAHEVWEYDDERRIQKLAGIVALCPLCHIVKHIGLAQVNGEYDIALKHLAKVNKWDMDMAKDYINRQFDKWRSRSKHEWKLDINWLELA